MYRIFQQTCYCHGSYSAWDRGNVPSNLSDIVEINIAAKLASDSGQSNIYNRRFWLDIIWSDLEFFSSHGADNNVRSFRRLGKISSLGVAYRYGRVTVEE